MQRGVTRNRAGNPAQRASGGRSWGEWVMSQTGNRGRKGMRGTLLGVADRPVLSDSRKLGLRQRASRGALKAAPLPPSVRHGRRQDGNNPANSGRSLGYCRLAVDCLRICLYIVIHEQVGENDRQDFTEKRGQTRNRCHLNLSDR